MRLWKGAAPGSHWHTTNAVGVGFFGPPGAAGPVASAALRHITLGSSPSPFVSFSTSYDVAYTYATLGGTIPGGFVYEVDTTLVPVAPMTYDPVQLISAATQFSHQHDGPQHLIAGVANVALAPSLSAVLTTAPLRFGGMAGVGAGPNVTQELTGLVRAIRDAEVLLASPVPADCIFARHLV